MKTSQSTDWLCIRRGSLPALPCLTFWGVSIKVPLTLRDTHNYQKLYLCSWHFRQPQLLLLLLLLADFSDFLLYIYIFMVASPWVILIYFETATDRRSKRLGDYAARHIHHHIEQSSRDLERVRDSGLGRVLVVCPLYRWDRCVWPQWGNWA